MNMAQAELADDLLEGTEEIKKFLFGNRSDRRRVYHLIDRGGLPHFRMGGRIYSRKSVLLRWIEAQQASASNSRAKAPS